MGRVSNTATLHIDLSDEALDRLADRLADRIACRMGGTESRSPDRWMDSRKAAEYLDLPRSALRKLTASNAIPYSQERPNAKCYFLRSQLDDWRLSRVQGQAQ